jgi:hypothetical protein
MPGSFRVLIRTDDPRFLFTDRGKEAAANQSVSSVKQSASESQKAVLQDAPKLQGRRKLARKF